MKPSELSHAIGFAYGELGDAQCLGDKDREAAAQEKLDALNAFAATLEPGQAPTGLKQWEYRGVKVPIEDEGAFTANLIRLGKLGWELCGLHPCLMNPQKVDSLVLVLQRGRPALFMTFKRRSQLDAETQEET